MWVLEEWGDICMDCVQQACKASGFKHVVYTAKILLCKVHTACYKTLLLRHLVCRILACEVKSPVFYAMPFSDIVRG